MDAPFELSVHYTVQCGQCKAMVSVGQWTCPPGTELPVPTLPDTWRNLGQEGLMCEQHRVKISSKKRKAS